MVYTISLPLRLLSVKVLRFRKTEHCPRISRLAFATGKLFKKDPETRSEKIVEFFTIDMNFDVFWLNRS